MTKSSNKSKAKIRVLLADDHHIVRTGIRQLLESAKDLEVVAEGADGEEAEALIEQHKPDVAVLDIQMPKASGIEVTRWVRGRFPEVGVLILTAYNDDPYVMAVLQAGANGYVLKQSASEELHEAIHAVLASKRFLSQKIALEVRESLEQEWVGSADYSGKLTEREREVLVLLSQGGSAKHIAQQLDISIKTVEFHRANITRKLGVHSISELTKFALAHGLTTL